MAVVSVDSRYSPGDGLRPIDLRYDLGQVADLIEVCFGRDLNFQGRGAIREMRLMSQLGPLVRVLSYLGNSSFWHHGFVWVEDGRIVGNISIQPSYTRADVWLLANVAVHPDYRRRGIARALTSRALETADGQQVNQVQLQVRDDNTAAQRLYESLGFRCAAIRTVWERGRRRPLPTPVFPSKGAAIRLLRSGEWEGNYALLRQLRPEGLIWHKPLVRRDFRPSVWRALDRFLQGRRVEQWGAFVGERQVAAMRIAMGYGTVTQLTIATDPDWQGQLGAALLNRAVRRLGRHPARVWLDHPHNLDVDLLLGLDFRPLRTLWWMWQRLR